MTSPVSRLQAAVMTVLVIIYIVLSQYSASTHLQGLGAALSLLPMLLFAVVLLWRGTRPLVAVMFAVVCGGLLYAFWPFFERYYTWADLAQQFGIYGLIAASFAWSMTGDRVPLCTQLAQKMHDSLLQGELSYTRSATLAWALFYGLLSVTILILFFMAPLPIWSLFVNVIVFVLIVLMGIADLLIRNRVLPRRSEGGILAVIRRSLIG